MPGRSIVRHAIAYARAGGNCSRKAKPSACGPPPPHRQPIRGEKPRRGQVSREKCARGHCRMPGRMSWSRRPIQTPSDPAAGWRFAGLADALEALSLRCVLGGCGPDLRAQASSRARHSVGSLVRNSPQPSSLRLSNALNRPRNSASVGAWQDRAPPSRWTTTDSRALPEPGFAQSSLGCLLAEARRALGLVGGIGVVNYARRDSNPQPMAP
jgi:hypothetical protein